MGRTVSGLEISLPATAANLGPAFDAAAIALDLPLEIRAQPAPAFSLSAQGRDAAICGGTRQNLILETYCDVLSQAGKAVTPLALTLQNQIPIGKGCGSSAAARLAGIALAVYFGELPWSDHRIVDEAARREGHPDNAAACWLGGLAVAQWSDSSPSRVRGLRQVHALSLAPAVDWPLLLAVPPEPLATEEARKVLPNQCSRSDAVANLQGAMLLLAAFVQGRGDLFRHALEDRLHEPYRVGLCPLLPALRKVAGTGGILGVALSGAGPSVLLIVDAQAPLPSARRQVEACLAEARLSAELIFTAIKKQGARQSRKPIPPEAPGGGRLP